MTLSRARFLCQQTAGFNRGLSPIFPKPIHKVIPALSRDPEGAGLRGPTYRLGGRNDEGSEFNLAPFVCVPYFWHPSV
jgi:hypothetical protein